MDATTAIPQQQQQQQQQQQHELHVMLWNEFRAGVTACLRSWSALRTAVEGQWGGVESTAKAEYLREFILEHLNASFQYPPRTLGLDELEDALVVYLEEQFTVVLEDNSDKQVAHTIWNMYQECAVARTSQLARQVVQAATTLTNDPRYAAAAQHAQVQSMEDDDDDGDDMMVDATTASAAPASPAVPPSQLQPPPAPLPQSSPIPNAAEYAAAYLFGPPAGLARTPQPSGPVRQLGAAAPEASAPQVDDDGFAPVARKGKKNR